MEELKYFVDADWLFSHMDDDDLFIIDSRFDLFNPAEYGAKAYGELHIKGAYYFDIDRDITRDNGVHGGRRGPASTKELGKKLASIGVKMDSQIVCYDDGVYAAPRTWWQLRYMGYEKVYVLDGGFNNWKEKGYPTSNGSSYPRGGGFFKEKKRDGMLADKDYVVAASSNPDKAIVDSRAKERFTGEVEPLYSKKGHIPGAINIHYLENMKSDSFIGTKNQWQQAFSHISGKEVILYCGSAIEAAINFMFLSELGENVRLYAGSMSDWITYDELEVVK